MRKLLIIVSLIGTINSYCMQGKTIIQNTLVQGMVKHALNCDFNIVALAGKEAVNLEKDFCLVGEKYKNVSYIEIKVSEKSNPIVTHTFLTKNENDWEMRQEVTEK